MNKTYFRKQVDSLPALRLGNLNLTGQVLEHHFSSSQPGMAVRIEHYDSVLFEGAFGLADVESGVQLTPEHLMQVDGIYGFLLSLLSMQLVESGRLRLTQTVGEFFPELERFSEISILDLLRHTSGIPEITPDKSIEFTLIPEVALYEKIKQTQKQFLNFSPGTRWEYCSSNLLLLQQVIWKITDQSVSSLVNKNIFRPLKMTSSIVTSCNAVIPQRARGYMQCGSTILRGDVQTCSNAIFSTAADLSRLFQELREGALLHDASWKQILQPYRDHRNANTKFGMNCFIHTDRLYNHVQIGGAGSGFDTNISYIPEHAMTIIVMTNCQQQPLDPITVTNLITDQIIPDIRISPDSKPKASHYVGDYSFVSYGIVSIYQEQHELLVSIGGDEPFRLCNIAPDVFAMAGTEYRFWFLRNEQGLVEKLEIRHHYQTPQEPPARKKNRST